MKDICIMLFIIIISNIIIMDTWPYLTGRIQAFQQMFWASRADSGINKVSQAARHKMLNINLLKYNLQS